jgi:hypothetical protein
MLINKLINHYMDHNNLNYNKIIYLSKIINQIKIKLCNKII